MRQETTPFRVPRRRVARYGLAVALLVALSALLPGGGRARAGTGADHTLLTIRVQKPGAAGSIVKQLDLAALKRFPHRHFTTTTIWTRGPQRFEGVLLSDLMAWLGVAPGAVIVAHATNDYAARIPLSDATDPGPIIAYRRNGQPMTLREKGPLWLVYPYDASPRWQTEVVYSRSIWQLEDIKITPGRAED